MSFAFSQNTVSNIGILAPRRQPQQVHLLLFMQAKMHFKAYGAYPILCSQLFKKQLPHHVALQNLLIRDKHITSIFFFKQNCCC